MRFKSEIRNVGTFAKFCASLSSLGPIAWCRLSDDDMRFTVLPEKGSQVWSVLKIETVFDMHTYSLQSAAPDNTVNLEVPIQSLQRALKSALGASSASIRLTKKNNVPMLSLTIVTATFSSGNGVVGAAVRGTDEEFGDFDFHTDKDDVDIGERCGGPPQERETIITQDVPVKVLAMQTVEGLHEPSTPEPDVHIYLPSLGQVKSISERFTKLATATKTGTAIGAGPRLELSANMHGSFKIALQTDALSISSVWTGLVNPELDVSNYQGGSQEIRDHPSTRMKIKGGEHGDKEEGWARVRIDAKDWNRVLSVGRLGVRVIACFMNETGLVLYVYHQGEDETAEETCLTYFINSFNYTGFYFEVKVENTNLIHSSLPNGADRQKTSIHVRLWPDYRPISPPSHDFIDVRIVVEGSPLTEFFDPEADGGDEGRTRTRYVEAKIGQAFGVQVKLQPAFDFQFAPSVYYEFSIDADPTESCQEIQKRDPYHYGGHSSPSSEPNKRQREQDDEGTEPSGTAAKKVHIDNVIEEADLVVIGLLEPATTTTNASQDGGRREVKRRQPRGGRPRGTTI